MAVPGLSIIGRVWMLRTSLLQIMALRKARA
jgi:hypothetical protein